MKEVVAASVIFWNGQIGGQLGKRVLFHVLELLFACINACPHVMKQILLRVAGVGAEVGGGEFAEALVGGAAAREVKFL